MTRLAPMTKATWPVKVVAEIHGGFVQWEVAGVSLRDHGRRRTLMACRVSMAW